MKRTLRFNTDRNIGTVIYFVEGGSTEFTLLKTIFGKILGYDYVAKRRGRPAKFIDNNCPYNRVFVINTSESNIKDISDKDFLDSVCETLINEYGLDLDNAAKFYLFDRDSESNTDKKQIEYYLDVLAEPYGDDTDFEKGGLLLLSYPAVESFVVSNFIEDSYKAQFKLGSELKRFIGNEENQKIIQFNKITPSTVEFATKEFITYLENVEIDFDLEELKVINKGVFEAEEAVYESSGKYNVVSELVLSLLYLGIVEIEEGK